MDIHAFDSHTSVIVKRKSLFCSVNAIIVFLSNKKKTGITDISVFFPVLEFVVKEKLELF